MNAKLFIVIGEGHETINKYFILYNILILRKRRDAPVYDYEYVDIYANIAKLPVSV